MKILGLSGGSHDCSASLIINGKIISSIEEERLTRKKHAPHSLPIFSAKEVIKQGKIKPKDIDMVAYFLDPSIFNKKVLNHIIFKDPKKYLFRPFSYQTHKFIQRGNRYLKELKKTLKIIGVIAPIKFVPHHLTHASIAFYLSPFMKSMVLSIDNMGELDSTLLSIGEGSSIQKIYSQNIPHSLGMLYATITNFLGFSAWSEEGKVMALAAFGNSIIPFNKIVELKKGKFKIKKDFQMIQTIKKDKLYSKGLIKILGKPRKRNEPLQQRHCDIAASIQYALEETVKYLVTHLYKKTKLRNLCLAGGVALNCKLNGELLKLPFIDEIYVSPASGDSGTSLGAAIYCHMDNAGKRPETLFTPDLGRSFSDFEINNVLKKFKLKYKKVKNPVNEATNRLIKEKIIAWFQGRSEFGPRALGYRSILGLPQKESTKDYINKKIKHREIWRPLCPSIISEEAKKYFENASFGRFMNVAVKAKKLAKKRVPAILHIDGTARIQKVYCNENPLYYNLLKNIGDKTGDPILLNTSFNLKEPIVDSPFDAINTFKKIPINSMIIGNFVVYKK